jgi:hypothetical protein
VSKTDLLHSIALQLNFSCHGMQIAVITIYYFSNNIHMQRNLCTVIPAILVSFIDSNLTFLSVLLRSGDMAISTKLIRLLPMLGNEALQSICWHFVTMATPSRDKWTIFEWQWFSMSILYLCKFSTQHFPTCNSWEAECIETHLVLLAILLETAIENIMYWNQCTFFVVMSVVKDFQCWYLFKLQSKVTNYPLVRADTYSAGSQVTNVFDLFSDNHWKVTYGVLSIIWANGWGGDA